MEDDIHNIIADIILFFNSLRTARFAHIKRAFLFDKKRIHRYITDSSNNYKHQTKAKGGYMKNIVFLFMLLTTFLVAGNVENVEPEYNIPTIEYSIEVDDIQADFNLEYIEIISLEEMEVVDLSQSTKQFQTEIVFLSPVDFYIFLNEVLILNSENTDPPVSYGKRRSWKQLT
jgi:hypothetical protein